MTNTQNTVLTYFVLNGLQDGEQGVRAVDTCGELQRDGWYYLLEGMDDGEGPYNSKAEALAAGQASRTLCFFCRQYVQTACTSTRENSKCENYGDTLLDESFADNSKRDHRNERSA